MITIKEEPVDYVEPVLPPQPTLPLFPVIQPVPMPSSNNLLTTAAMTMTTPQTISYPTLPYKHYQETITTTVRKSRSPSPPEKKLKKKKKRPSPSPSESESSGSASPMIKQSTKNKKNKATKKYQKEDTPETHTPSLKRFGVKEIQDVDAKTTFYKYDGKKEDNRTPSERKILLEKVSAILDKVNEECKHETDDVRVKSGDHKHKKSKEIILNTETKSVTVVSNKHQQRRSSPVSRRSSPVVSRRSSPAAAVPLSYRRHRSASPPSRSRSGSGEPRRYWRGGHRSPAPRRSWTRSPPPRWRSRSRSPPRHGRYRSRSRSWSPYGGRWPQYTRPMWIAVSPVSIENDVKLDKNTEQSVSVILRDKFWFESNKDCRVKITKWTGRDCISSLVIKPQVITLAEENKMDINIENPYYDKQIKLLQYDKIGCLSILSSPVPRSIR